MSSSVFFTSRSRLNTFAKERCNQSRSTQIWFSGFGDRYDYKGNSAILDYDSNFWGVMGGVDKKFSRTLFAGFMAGYGKSIFKSNSRFTNSYNNNADGVILGAYARQLMGKCFLDLELAGGLRDYSHNRFVNDNLAALGNSNAVASYDSSWISPEVGFGANIMTSQGFLFIPSLRYRYAYEDIDGFTETGSNANAFVPSRQIGVGEVKMELAAAGKISCVDLAARIGYFFRNPCGDKSARVTMIAQSATIPFFTNGVSAGYLGADAAMELGCNTTLFVGGEITSGDGIHGLRGAVNLVRQF
jgi:uncharacterized protein with beta-barrel porin domain